MIAAFVASASITAWIGIHQATSGSLGTAEGDPPVRVIPVEEPQAFLRPQTERERAAQLHGPIASAVPALAVDDNVREDWKPGNRTGGIRILLDGLGASDRQIFAFLTARGRVCAGLTDFTSGCFAALPEREGLTMTYGDPDAEGMGEGTIIWGLAASRVKSISARVAARNFPAQLGDNAYFFQVADPSLPASALQALNVTYRDGTHEEVAVPTGPRIPVAFG